MQLAYGTFMVYIIGIMVKKSKRKQGGVYVALRDRVTRKARGSIVLECLSPTRALKILGDAERDELAKKLNATVT